MVIIASNYNANIDWILDYADDYFIYDRSDDGYYLSKFNPEKCKQVPNRGTDIYDKLTYIIDNYDNLPDVALYTKGNIFKYITLDEFEKIKDNKTFTPVLTQGHTVYGDVCYYENGIYYEINNRWYLNGVPHKNVDKYDDLIGHKYKHQTYKGFAPGTNYIIPKKNILKHPKEFYVKLRSLLEYDRYPGEAFLIERDMINIFK